MTWKNTLVTSIVLSLPWTSSAQVAGQGMKGMKGGEMNCCCGPSGMMGGGMMGGSMMRGNPMMSNRTMGNPMTNRLPGNPMMGMNNPMMGMNYPMMNNPMMANPMLANPMMGNGMVLSMPPANYTGNTYAPLGATPPAARKQIVLENAPKNLIREDSTLVRTAGEQERLAKEAFARGAKAEQDRKLLLAATCYFNAFNLYPDAAIAEQARTAHSRVEQLRARQVK